MAQHSYTLDDDDLLACQGNPFPQGICPPVVALVDCSLPVCEGKEYLVAQALPVKISPNLPFLHAVAWSLGRGPVKVVHMNGLGANLACL